MQPVIIEDTISIAANSVNENVIASNTSLRRYLRSPFRAKGKLLAIQSAAGLQIDFDYGSKNVVASSHPRVTGTLSDPENIVSDAWWCEEGDMMVLKVTNTTAGALSLRYRLELREWNEELPPDCRVITRGPINVPAAAVDQQLLDGLRYERAPVDSIAEFYITASATGMLRTINVDTENVAPPAAVTPANSQVREPFDLTVAGVEAPKDKQIELAVSNPTGGALSVWFKLRLQEVRRT